MRGTPRRSRDYTPSHGLSAHASRATSSPTGWIRGRIVVSPVFVYATEVLSRPPADEDIPDESDRFLVAVTFRIGRLGMPVVVEFTSPEPRTIVMRIVDGKVPAASSKNTPPLGRAPTDYPARQSWKPS